MIPYRAEGLIMKGNEVHIDIMCPKQLPRESIDTATISPLSFSVSSLSGLFDDAESLSAQTS